MLMRPWVLNTCHATTSLRLGVTRTVRMLARFLGRLAWTPPSAGGSTAAFNTRRGRPPGTPFVGPSFLSLCPTGLASMSASTTSGPCPDMFDDSAAQFTAADTADILLNEYIPLWGCPVTLLSDNGQQFTSKLANIVYDRLGIQTVNISAYNFCTNGGVERVNHVLARTLSMVGNKQQTDWDVLLPHVSSTYNNSVNATTELAPNKIHMGHVSRLPLSVFEPDNIGGHQSLDREHLIYINIATDQQRHSLVHELH